MSDDDKICLDRANLERLLDATQDTLQRAAPPWLSAEFMGGWNAAFTALRAVAETMPSGGALLGEGDARRLARLLGDVRNDPMSDWAGADIAEALTGEKFDLKAWGAEGPA